MKKITYALCIGIFITAFGTARFTHATLGEPAESVMADRKAISADRSTTTVRNGYTIQEVISDSVSVREYISPSGVVFGIAWNGLTHPDLTLLLGAYTGEYQEALKQTPRKYGRRFSQVRTDRVVVEKWGHMRHLQGRAYAPALIPSGVSIDEIK